MSTCELTGKRPMFGNNVSHSERKTRRTFGVNIQKKFFVSEALKERFSFRVCTNAIKTIDKCGLDAYLLKASAELLSKKAKTLKCKIKKETSAN
jgi:large subunit ribosomal protein L28